MKKKKGFTLAELLITLTMVGIIATLVIPPVAQRIQQVQLKIAFKENYSIIDKAFQRAIQNNGGTFAGIATNEGDVDVYVLTDILAPYLNYVKISDSPGVCWHPDNKIKVLNGDYFNYATYSQCLMLTNGAMFVGWGQSGSCKFDEGWGHRYTCGVIFLDVNGFKGPNVVSKDIFMIHIQADRIVPGGVDWSQNQDDCENEGANGWGCGIYVLLNEDY